MTQTGKNSTKKSETNITDIPITTGNDPSAGNSTPVNSNDNDNFIRVQEQYPLTDNPDSFILPGKEVSFLIKSKKKSVSKVVNDKRKGTKESNESSSSGAGKQSLKKTRKDLKKEKDSSVKGEKKSKKELAAKSDEPSSASKKSKKEKSQKNPTKAEVKKSSKKKSKPADVTFIRYEDIHFVDSTKPVWNYSMLTEEDIKNFQNGTHYRLYEILGSHPQTVLGKEGYYFAVWAPNATYISVIGNFNDWETTAHPLFVRLDKSGIWEGFIPNIPKGESYKYHIHGFEGQFLF